MQLIDIGANLTHDSFDHDRDAVMQRARDAGVARMIVTGASRAHSPMAAELARAHPGELYATAGVHPHHATEYTAECDAEMRALQDMPEVVAVGECGLDYFVEGLDPDTQRFYFQRQLELAREFDLPVVVHARRAVEEVIGALRRVPGLRGVVHSYSGSEEQARQLFALGFCLGIGGPVTYERARRIRRVVAETPPDFLLLETDAPDQPDAERRGQRNEPAHLVSVLETIARLRGIEPEELATATTANARRLFRTEALASA